ncbi:glycosyltransferase family 2 protein [Leuconostoc suionicum]|uniref:glycosyltransferase family 2 protein n=1 Tax=Leuconostoc suionicum TaxID=1511761 RepID=UPI0024AD5F6C|nr:glycosyltransferase family 2 protein [Leuconostoc suionicum]MDI6650772.1 glycosyltransferase family 2 protein [Leuconostoc suionicum]
MKKKKVSVIITAYNAEKTIFEAIQTVLHQTYNNIEVIVINDGSTDDTRTVLTSFLDKIILIETNNEGPGAARNAGIGSATGDFIMFIDGDDYLTHENVVENLVNISEKNNAKMVVAGFNYVDTKGKLLSKRRVEPTIENMYSGAWGKLYTKNLWDNVRFPEDILYEDAGVIMAVALLAGKISLLNESIYAYRQNKKTITQSLDSPERHLDSIKAFIPYMDMVDLLENYEVKRSAIHYMNHIILGHAVVVKVEYISSAQQVAVLKQLLQYMESPLLKKDGFSSRFISDKVQRITFKLLKTDKLQSVLDILLGFAINIRNKKRNKRR